MSASNYYFNSHPHSHPHPHSTPSNASTHSGRGRRAPRMAQNHNKQFRNVRKEEEAVVITQYRQHFEASRGFDLEDDLEFCPFFVTEDDYASSSSDRSSMSSGSPAQSPQSHQATPDTFSLNSNSSPYVPSYQIQTTPLKLHQPAATRVRNAIPIVNPNARMSSPPNSVSPARMHQQQQHQQHLTRRW